MKVLITSVPFGNLPGHASLNLLEAAGLEYKLNPVGRRLTERELMDHLQDSSILIAGTEPITARAMDTAPHLKLIARVGIGLDNVDLKAARDREIDVHARCAIGRCSGDDHRSDARPVEKHFACGPDDAFERVEPADGPQVGWTRSRRAWSRPCR